MSTITRPPAIHHCTSEPLRFFGRAAELAQLDLALRDSSVSVVGLMGLGGQGKTAIVQHWLQQLPVGADRPDGLFFWSFYRGKDADVCLRELHAYAENLHQPADVSASFCVDRLLPILRREHWVIVFDGAEVVQHESGAWQGRFAHPELGRLVEELAGERLPGVLVLTTRFPLPTLKTRRYAQLIDLTALDPTSARSLLRGLGVQGDDAALDEAAIAMSWHAKGVELLGTWLVQFANAVADRYVELAAVTDAAASAEERVVAQVLAAFQAALPAVTCDILALATAFRQPPAERQLLDYLGSGPVQLLLTKTWHRAYEPLDQRGNNWLARQIQWLVDLRLLERVGAVGHQVIDAHPLVRRGFENILGQEGHRHSATARAGFLRGRPDRRPPTSLAETHEECELFHAYCDAGLWNEADSILVALDNPKHRFLAPAFERDLLLRFFPDGDWRQPPLWHGFGRWRSLAICLEMLGQFADALEVYRPADAALRGDALIALGRLEPLLTQESMPQPWQNLWRAYRAHALCLVGRTAEAVALARSLIPVDIYEWVHVFECLLRAGQWGQADFNSMAASVRGSSSDDWCALVQRRIAADWRRLCDLAADLDSEYTTLTVAFDRGGMPWERALVRLGHARWLTQRGCTDRAMAISGEALDLAQRFSMPIIAADASELAGDEASNKATRLLAGYWGVPRR